MDTDALQNILDSFARQVAEYASKLAVAEAQRDLLQRRVAELGGQGAEPADS